MIKKISFCSVVLATLAVAAAAPPVAKVLSSGRFSLRGADVQTGGVPSWPVMSGDEIATSSSAATVQFADGSKVNITPNSRAKVEAGSNGLVFRLLSGGGDFTLTRNSAVKIYNNTALVTGSSGQITNAAAASNSAHTQALRPPPPPISSR